MIIEKAHGGCAQEAIWEIPVKRWRFSAGEFPPGSLLFQAVAIGAEEEVTKPSKPPVVMVSGVSEPPAEEPLALAETEPFPYVADLRYAENTVDGL